MRSPDVRNCTADHGRSSGAECARKETADNHGLDILCAAQCSMSVYARKSLGRQRYAQCGHHVHEQTSGAGNEIDGLSSKLFTERCSSKRKKREPECIHGKSNRCLELSSVQVTRHGREAQSVCPRRRSYRRKQGQLRIAAVAVS